MGTAFAATSPIFSRPRHSIALSNNPACNLSPPLTSTPPTPTPTPRPADGPFALAAIAIFRRVMRPHLSSPAPTRGYAGLVDDCRRLLSNNSPSRQREIVLGVLSTLFASPRGPALFREKFASKPALNAAITPLFFRWLVGPAETNTSPEGGVENAGVLIEKCRFLEESGCRGLCVNMCQQPTQAFFTEELGLPLRMTPSFEEGDFSCQMTFGLAPLKVEEDPAATGGCLEGCKMSGVFKSDEGVADEKACYVTQATDAVP